MRGPLARRDIPSGRTRSAVFDELVAGVLHQFQRSFGPQISHVTVLVEDVPSRGLLAGLDASDTPPTSSSHPARGSAPPQVTIYRRPITRRSTSPAMTRELVVEALVHEFSAVLGVRPDDIDPR
jgi:predicted Zn-dependent protease with MMP-like domain